MTDGIHEIGEAENSGPYDGLRVCRKLTDNKNFYSCGNGLGGSFEGKLVVWRSSSRMDGMPNKRTKKSELGNYLQQDAIEALLAMANISERVAPYVWVEEQNPYAPERFFGCTKKGRKVLLDEAASFIDRFGFSHMGADGFGPGTRKCPVETGRLQFSGNPKQEHLEQMASLKEIFQGEHGASLEESYIARLKKKGLFYPNDDKRTDEAVFIDGLKPICKDFSACAGFDDEKAKASSRHNQAWERVRMAIDMKDRESLRKDGSLDEAVFDKWLAKEDALLNLAAQIHVDERMLIDASVDAYSGFDEEERTSLSKWGYWLPEADALYDMSLLYRDALEIYAAMTGDESAFERVLTKVHMEKFDVEMTGEESSYAKDVEDEISDRYVMWFESCGRDRYWPGTNLIGCECEVKYKGLDFTLSRKPVKWSSGNELYGGGRRVFVLCGRGETPDYFRVAAFRNLGSFLNGLISEGLNGAHQGYGKYVRYFAPHAKVDPNNPIIRVNDVNTDLSRTLWEVMRLIATGEVALKLDRCKCCGRFINRAHEAGNVREFCDSSCRSLYKKRIAAKEKSGKASADATVRHEFYSFMESGRGVNMGQKTYEDYLAEEKSQNSVARKFLAWMGVVRR